MGDDNAINRNMGCIEMFGQVLHKKINLTINRNMGCIEIVNELLDRVDETDKP